MPLQVSQLFPIIQGEGTNSGLPQFLVRLSGCPLRCTFCDSPYAQKLTDGELMDIPEIAEKINESGYDWVCVSGGEPLMQYEGLRQLITYPSLRGCKWEIETSGFYPPPYWFGLVELWVVDFKCPSSEMESKSIYSWVALNAWKSNHANIKFVVGDETDLQFALEHRPDKGYSILSPVVNDVQEVENEIRVGKEQTAWNKRVAEFALENNFRYSVQVHKYVWGQYRNDV